MSDNSQIERLTVEQGHRGINSGDRSDALRLLTAILNEAVIGAASLQEMGARASVMCRRLVPAVAMVPLSMDELLLSYAWDIMVPSDIAEMDRELVVELVTDSGRALRSARDLGRRVSLLAYAFRPQCAAEVEDVLPTLGKLGELWGLSAENKRSAPSAALKVLMDDLIVKASGRMHHGAAFTPWFAKSRAASVVFAEAQEGNTNRRDGRKRA